MLAAGRGVFVGPEIGSRGWTAAVDFYRLAELESQFELFTIWKKQPEETPTIQKFIEILEESVKLAEVVGKKGK